MPKASTRKFSNRQSSVRLFLMLLSPAALFAATFALLGLCPASLSAQPAAKPAKVFVWTFRSNAAEDEPMLDNVTDEFVTVLHDSKKYILLDRTNLGSLLSRRQEEMTDMSNIGSKDQAAMQTKGAEAVFFGKVFHDVDSGQVRVTVTLESFDSQILFTKSRNMRPPEWKDSERRQQIFHEMLGIPVSSVHRTLTPGTAPSTSKAAANPPQPNQQFTISGNQGAVNGINNGTVNINNGPSKVEHKQISLEPALLHTYVGEYAANQYMSVTVSQEGNRLFAEGAGWPKTEMLAEAPREFFFEKADIQITIMDPGPNGQASGIIVHQKLGDTPFLRSSNGSAPNGAKRLADSSYDYLTRFLDQAHGQAATISNVQQSVAASTGDQIISEYHGSYEVLVKNALDRLNASHQPVAELTKLSQNVQSLDDIRKLRDGFKPFSDRISVYVAMSLDRLVRMADTRTAALSRPNPASSDASMLNLYRMSYGRAINDNLAKLKEKGVNVESLTQLQNNLQSLQDVERLAAGFKQLSESLSR